MSIKIYDGFVIDVPLTDIMPIIYELRDRVHQAVTPRFRDASCRKLVDLVLKPKNFQSKEVLNIIAKYTSFPKLFPDDMIFAGKILAERVAEHNHKTDVRSELDYDPNTYIDLNLSVFPYGGKTYGIAYGNSELISLFMSYEDLGIHPFFYWNNTDKAENVEEYEWNNRKTVWNEILKTGVPLKDGLQVDICSPNTFLSFCVTVTPEDVTNFLCKNRDQYVRSLVYEAVEEDLIQELNPENSAITMSFVCELTRIFKERYKNNDPQISKVRAQVENDFPENYEDLTKFVSNHKLFFISQEENN